VHHARRRSEEAITDVEAILAGGNTMELSAALLRGIFERGRLEHGRPDWSDGARSGAPTRQPRRNLVFPIPTRPRELVEGTSVWVDNGINFRRYQSD